MDRETQIAERRKQIPKKFRSVYARSLKRGNLRAAINAQCLECVGWVSDEVRKCTDLACPLYVHRKIHGEYCLIAESPSCDQSGCLIGVESTNSARQVGWGGYRLKRA